MFYIKELREGENIKEIYLCKQCQSLQSKTGKTYISLILQDKTGTLDGKVWDINNAIAHFEEMDFISVEGRVVLYQDKPQLNISRIRRAAPGEYDPTEYVPTSRFAIDDMYKELLSICSRVKEPHLKALLDSFFVEDKNFIATFRLHSAAKTLHHGFIGGLLEHTVSVARVCEAFASNYEVLNHDLLVTAALLHDIGKTREISDFPSNDYTDEGNLLGHIVIGSEMVSERIAAIPGFPKLLRDELKHCIIAHHGKLEYGSPKLPALSEALALSFADNLDAKMESMRELLDGMDIRVDWMGYQKNFESNMRRTDI